MPYDIYGCNLKRGHCEVHPDIAEEYPCSLCMERNQERERYPPEPDYPEPTLIDYIGIDAKQFREVAEAIAVAIEKNDEGSFSTGIKSLLKILNPEYLLSEIRTMPEHNPPPEVIDNEKP